MTTDSKGIWPVELKEQYMRGKYLYKEFMDIVSREAALAYEKYKDLHFSKSGVIGMMERTTEYQRYSALIDLYNEFERDKGHFIQYEKKAPDKAETPEYIQNLIEKKLLYPDGKRVLGSLDALIDALGPQPAQFIQETFLKANGKPYTLKHIQDVMAGRKLAD